MTELPPESGSPGELLPPPLPSLSPPPVPLPRRGRLAWLGHLLVLTGWIVALILLWFRRHHSPLHPPLPVRTVRGVLLGTGINALCFGVVCAAAWLCSRATAAEWRLRWRGGAGPVWRGFLYSFALRIATVVITLGILSLLVACHVLEPSDLAKLRSHPENAISLQSLVNDRAFYWCALIVLCASAGILEETWRGGMLAGLAGAFPAAFAGPVGSWVAIVPVAILFGLAHLYMGGIAAAAAGVLGLALGAITVWHRTIWDAAIAHALFDAGSLAMLAWTFQHYPQSFGQ